MELRPQKNKTPGIDVLGSSDIYLQGLDITTSIIDTALIRVSDATLNLRKCKLHDTPKSTTGLARCLDIVKSNFVFFDGSVTGCDDGLISSDSNVTLDQVVASNNRYTGILASGPSNSKQFKGTMIVANKNDVGISLQYYTKPYLDRVVTQENGIGSYPTGYGLYLYQVTEALVSNLLSTGNTVGVNWEVAPCPGTCTASKMYNATVAYNTGYEFSCTGVDGDELHVMNSIAWDSTGAAVNGSQCKFSYCDVYGGVGGVSNIKTNPMFISKSSGNFRLDKTGSMSPCIDTGDPKYKGPPNFDLDGKKRVVGVAVDMGAYEVQ